MTVDIDPSARIQIRTRGQLLPPGCCCVCGSATCERGYVDPAVFYEWEGQVYFCVPCAEEIAGTIGCLTEDESEFLKNQTERLGVELKELKEKYAHATDRLAAYDSVIGSVLTSSIAADLADDNASQGTEPNGDTAPSRAESEPVTLESIKKRRSDDATRSASSNHESAFSI